MAVLYYGKGSSGSVVDPETSGHFRGGFWRHWGIVAPKLRSGWRRTIGSRAGLFFLWAQLKVNCYRGRELEGKGRCGLALSTTHSCGHTVPHTPGYSCWRTHVAVHSAFTHMVTHTCRHVCKHPHAQQYRHTTVCTRSYQAGALCNRKGSGGSVVWQEKWIPS